MQVANLLAHLIEPLDGPGRYPVRAVRFGIPVHASCMMRCRSHPPIRRYVGIMKIWIHCALFAALAAIAIPSHSQDPAIPQDIARQLPEGYAEVASKSSDFNEDGKADYVVVVRNKNEAELVARGSPAPKRPLLVFIQGKSGAFSLESRNDEVVFAADAGGQCDPFMDGMGGLAVKGSFFTVQNAVACGEHWTDFLTFRFSTELRRFVFHKRVFESISFNSSNEPGAPALVPGVRSIVNGNKAKPVFLDSYRPNT